MVVERLDQQEQLVNASYRELKLQLENANDLTDQIQTSIEITTGNITMVVERLDQQEQLVNASYRELKLQLENATTIPTTDILDQKVASLNATVTEFSEVMSSSLHRERA